MRFDSKPDLSFDAYLSRQGRRGPLCDVQVWLPKQPNENGRVEVTGIGLNLEDLRHVGDMSLVHADEPSLIELRDIFIRSAELQIDRKVRAAELRIEHVGMLVERSTGWPVDAASVQVNHAVFLLSEMGYAIPATAPRMDYLGNINNERLDSPFRLAIQHQFGVVCSFTLERHWNWTPDKKSMSVLGRSNPVLAYTTESEVALVTLSVLQECAEVAALLLSLASRWRIIVYGVMASVPSERYREWSNLLLREKAQNIEESEGYLVKLTELESFMRIASARMTEFNQKQRDAVRLAIFALFPILSETQETCFLKRFAALEGLARFFGNPLSKAGMHTIIPALIKAFPPHVGGLWPILGDQGLAGLKDLRNELAHGRNFSREVPGALSLANDHLQLWMEGFLMAILHANFSVDRSNWLARNALRQRDEVQAIRQALHADGIAGK